MNTSPSHNGQSAEQPIPETTASSRTEPAPVNHAVEPTPAQPPAQTSPLVGSSQSTAATASIDLTQLSSALPQVMTLVVEAVRERNNGDAVAARAKLESNQQVLILNAETKIALEKLRSETESKRSTQLTIRTVCLIVAASAILALALFKAEPAGIQTIVTSIGLIITTVGGAAVARSDRKPWAKSESPEV